MLAEQTRQAAKRRTSTTCVLLLAIAVAAAVLASSPASASMLRHARLDAAAAENSPLGTFPNFARLRVAKALANSAEGIGESGDSGTNFASESRDWQSTDPILASYMRGQVNGGVFNPGNLGLYTYSRNNPIVLRDPDGKAYEFAPYAMSNLEVITNDPNASKAALITMTAMAAGGAAGAGFAAAGAAAGVAAGQAMLGSYAVGGAVGGLTGQAMTDAYAGQMSSLDAYAEAAAGGAFMSMAVGSALRGAGALMSRAPNGMAKSFAGGPLNIAQATGMLRDAATLKGNVVVGSATAAEAEALGTQWVGPGARPIMGGKGLISKDGLRVYRAPAAKTRGVAAGRVQANLERYQVDGSGNRVRVSNAHIDVRK